MQFSILIFYLLSWTCYQVSLSATDNRKLDNRGQVPVLRITNGLSAEIGKFPYVVLITYSGRATCTGSIIHKNWVLTAAHCCFAGRQHEAAVVTTIFKNGTIYRVKEFITHSEFKHIPETENEGIEYVIHDIALFHVEKSIEFNEHVSPISLPTHKINYNYYEYASIVGWGRTKFFSVKPSTLQYAMVQLLPENQCKKDWPYVTYAHHLCTSTSERKSACYGDSGGPVVYKGVQVGVICTADTYCSFKKANLHTRVANYVEWIKYQLSKSNDTV